MRATLSLLAAAMLAIGCTSIPTIPTIPSIPPIVIPSLPPFEIPSGLLGSGNPAGDCPLASAAEMAAIYGEAPALAEGTDTGCTFLFSNFGASVVLTVSKDSSLDASRFLFGTSAKDITVGGLPALSGQFLGFPAVHVQRGADQLQVQGFAVEGTSIDDTIAKLVQVATVAVSHWPAG
jgi:hypothetical protein